MRKDVVIIGSHPSTELSKDTLKQCILNLNGTFDVVLSTHYPVGDDIQQLVNYYIYDSFNELIEGSNNPIVWFKNDMFYLQVRHIKNYAYSAYSCMMNGLRLLQTKYDYFYYINGDTLIESKDIEKLKNMKQIALSQGKKSLFFKEFSGMVDSKIFFSEIKYFLNTIGIVDSKKEFVKYTEAFGTPYIPYVLESFFAERIDGWSKQNVFVLHEAPDKYFSNSQIDVLNSFNGKSERRRDYSIYLIKEKNSNRIFFVYSNSTVDFEKKQINVKIDDDAFVLDNGNYALYKEVLVKADHIQLEIDGVSNIYLVKDILENYDSYIEFN